MTTDIAHRLAMHHELGMKRAARQANECIVNDVISSIKMAKGHDWQARHDRKFTLWMVEKDLLIECYNIINPNNN